jgi:hypothetical protein
MKKIQAILRRNENAIFIPGLVLAFIAGCLVATIFWYLIV